MVGVFGAHHRPRTDVGRPEAATAQQQQRGCFPCRRDAGTRREGFPAVPPGYAARLSMILGGMMGISCARCRGQHCCGVSAHACGVRTTHSVLLASLLLGLCWLRRAWAVLC